VTISDIKDLVTILGVSIAAVSVVFAALNTWFIDG
jgi:hypothetical protein